MEPGKVARKAWDTATESAGREHGCERDRVNSCTAPEDT